MPSMWVITIVHGRHQHLRRQLESLEALTGVNPAGHVVVAMDDPEIDDLCARHARRAGGGRPPVVMHLPVAADGQLPLAEARNVGASHARSAGAQILLFLDVDCLADPLLVLDYLAAIQHTVLPPGSPPVLWCGEVAYLPALPPGLHDYPLTDLRSWARPHPVRPQPAPSTVQLSPDTRLFWSLNFAVRMADWTKLGGFHTGYRGYGGEDTDLAAVLAAEGGLLGWTGGARAYHQHHPTSSPPWQHLDAILRNARVFHDRWGRFPMEGWLKAFAEAGAIRWDPEAGVLERLSDG